MGQQQGPQVKRTPLCHINEIFVNAGQMCEGWVAMINNEVPQEQSNRVRPPKFELGHWQIIIQPGIFGANIMQFVSPNPLVGPRLQGFSLVRLIFCYQIYINTAFLHLFLYSHPFSFVCMFIVVAIKRYRSNNESCEGTNTKDPDVDFEQLVNQTGDGEDEDWGASPRAKRND